MLVQKPTFVGGATARFAPLRISIALAALAISAPAALAQSAPPPASVADFLARADKLASLGPLALAAPDGKRLKAEFIDTARRYRARNEAQRKAGQTRTSCPPEKGALEPEVWINHLRSYPAAQRPRITMAKAFDDFMVQKYPC